MPLSRDAAFTVGGLLCGILLGANWTPGVSPENPLPEAEANESEPSVRQLSEAQRCNRNGHLLPTLLGLDDSMLDQIAAELKAMPPAVLPPLQLPLSAQVNGVKLVSSHFSWLQQAYVRLHRILFERKLLPLSQFGELRGHGSKNTAYYFDKAAISRRAVVLFVRRENFRVPGHAVCMGWDTLQHLPGRCNLKKSWVFTFEPGNPTVDVSKRRFAADITKLSAGAPAGVPLFDLIVCNEVLEHVPDPFAATRSLFTLLKPGGHVFFTAPGPACRHHFVHDYFRYTIGGARSIFSSAGFEVLLQQRVGNTYITSGFVVGMGTGDFDIAWSKAQDALMFRNDSAGEIGPNEKIFHEDPQEWLYLSTVGVFRKPKTSG